MGEDSAMFQYLTGDDQSETALLKAQLEHMGGALGREIEINNQYRNDAARDERVNNELRASLSRITAERDGLKRALEAIVRGSTAVLISAALDECPINPDVLKQINQDAGAALARTTTSEED